MMPPQIDGTVESISSGNHPTVTLKDVTIVDTNRKMMHKSTKTLPLPPGHFVSKDHWQSDGDTLDLFIGEGFSMDPTTGEMMGGGTGDQGFAGVVQSIDSHEMVVKKVLYGSNGNHEMKMIDQKVSIRFAPYTRVFQNGMGNAQPPASIHVGDGVLFVLIGPPNEYIAAQITDFRSPKDAGWDMQ